MLMFQHRSVDTTSADRADRCEFARGPALNVAQVRETGMENPAADPCPPVPNKAQHSPAEPRPRQGVVLLRTAGNVERHPVLTGPLTSQERGLIQLVRTADPQQLASMSSEAQARLKAQDAEQFDKFFCLARPTKASRRKRMNPHDKAKRRLTMKLANAILTLTLTAVFSGSLAVAQNASSSQKPDMEVRTFYLNSGMQGSDDAHEILNALRSALDSHDISTWIPRRTPS